MDLEIFGQKTLYDPIRPADTLILPPRAIRWYGGQPAADTFIDFISQSAATTETHTNDIVKKIKRENKKLKYKLKS